MTYNGREACLNETLDSLDRNLSGPITRRVLVDDSGGRCPARPAGFVTVAHRDNEGMAATVQDAWTAALADSEVRFVLHWEDDMRLDRALDVGLILPILDAWPNLAQMVFQRHGVNAVEAQGQLRAICAQATKVQRERFFTIHDHLFSLNPCLIPRHVCERGWPSGPIGTGNEDGMTAKCKAAGLEFAHWGTVDDEPYVTHIGHERGAAWQL